MKRTALKVIKRSEVIGKIKKIKVKKVIKRPKVIGNNDKRKRYVNPITFNYVLRPTYLAASSKIKKKDEELQRKFEKVSQKIEEKINDPKSWFT